MSPPSPSGAGPCSVRAIQHWSCEPCEPCACRCLMLMRISLHSPSPLAPLLILSIWRTMETITAGQLVMALWPLNCAQSISSACFWSPLIGSWAVPREKCRPVPVIVFFSSKMANPLLYLTTFPKTLEITRWPALLASVVLQIDSFSNSAKGAMRSVAATRRTVYIKCLPNQWYM